MIADVQTIHPTQVGGKAQVPSSKSLCHRAILAAALAEGESQIHSVSFSEDIEATLDVVRALGAQITPIEQGLHIKGIGGAKRMDAAQPLHIDCRESGSTLRFVVPILAALGISATYTGKGRLGERPMDVYYQIFEKQNMQYETAKGRLPLTVRSSLQAGDFVIDGGISSQFITGLLMALPLLAQPSTLRIFHLQSRPYVDLTLEVLRLFGIVIHKEEQEETLVLSIPGRQRYHSACYTVEPDASQAAFWIAAGGIAAEKQGLLIRHYTPETVQGDKVFLDLFAALGGRFCHEAEGLRVFRSKLQGDQTVDVSQCPDLVPIMAVLGTYNQGRLHIVGAGRVRIKESDRLAAISRELGRLGAQITEEPEGLWVHAAALHGGTVESWNDHRIAMALGVAALGAHGPVYIQGAGSAAKSWPSFWDDFKQIMR